MAKRMGDVSGVAFGVTVATWNIQRVTWRNVRNGKACYQKFTKIVHGAFDFHMKMTDIEYEGIQGDSIIISYMYTDGR